MDKGLHIEETAGPILMILVSKFSMENSPGPHVFRFLILPQGGPPWPLEVGKFEGSFQSQKGAHYVQKCAICWSNK